MHASDELIIDNFAGGGGASTGIELATGRPVSAAINHDPAAIAMHIANHPRTRHYCENIWDIDPRKVADGKPVALVWLSPDCTHFSKAKGGKPVKKEIRGLAWVAVRWAATVKPRVIILENVEEFKSWGPIKDGQPIKEQSGRTFNSFINALRTHGYSVEWKELRACDYGAPTIRKRLFIIARCDNRPIVWPGPTHGDPSSTDIISGKLKPWRSAAEIINWELPCPSIFATSEEIWEQYGIRTNRPLADATMNRVGRGMKKFVIDEPEPFIVKVNHGGDEFRGQAVREPLQTITSKLGYGLVAPYIMPNNTHNIPTGAAEPLPTITSGNRNYLIAPTLMQYHGERSDSEVRGQRVTDPLFTVDVSNRYALCAAFMSKHYGGGYKGSGSALAEPLHTVTAQDHNAVVTSHLTLFRNHSVGQSLNEPLNTIMTSTGHFAEVRAFMVKYCGRKAEQSRIIEKFDHLWEVADIGLRMLTPRELFNAQGFPPDYNIDVGAPGRLLTKAEQVARCGNAVPPPFAEALTRVNLPELCGSKITTMAELAEKIAV